MSATTARASTPSWFGQVVGALTFAASVQTAGCGYREPSCADPNVICCAAGHARENADVISPSATSAARVAFGPVAGFLTMPRKEPADPFVTPWFNWLMFKVPGPGRVTIDYEWGDATCPCSFVLTDELGYKLEAGRNSGRPARVTVWASAGGDYFIRFRIDPGKKGRATYRFTADWEAMPSTTDRAAALRLVDWRDYDYGVFKLRDGKARAPRARILLMSGEVDCALVEVLWQNVWGDETPEAIVRIDLTSHPDDGEPVEGSYLAVFAAGPPGEIVDLGRATYTSERIVRLDVEDRSLVASVRTPGKVCRDRLSIFPGSPLATFRRDCPPRPHSPAR